MWVVYHPCVSDRPISHVCLNLFPIIYIYTIYIYIYTYKCTHTYIIYIYVPGSGPPPSPPPMVMVFPSPLWMWVLQVLYGCPSPPVDVGPACGCESCT